MMKVIVRKWLLLACFIACPVWSGETDSIQWTLSNEGLESTGGLLDSKSLPGEMTQVLREIRTDVEPDKVTTRTKVINFFPRFVDTEKFGSQSIFYNPSFESLRVTVASTVTPSGAVKQIEPSTVKILSTNDYNTFRSGKEVVLAFPALEKGSFSVLEYETVTHRAPMESDWSTELYTQRTYPIKSYKLDVSWPDDSPMSFASSAKNIVCTEKATSVTCKGEDIPAYQGDYNAHWRDHIDLVAIGELDSWNQVVDKTLLAMSKAEESTDGLEVLVHNLVKSTDLIDERIENILNFVARDIRYVSMSEYGNAMTPHTLSETIENRFGDCKDKSVLLKALLEESGIDPVLVLVSTERSDGRRLLVPTMNTFNHVVVCFDLKGKEYCLDPTDPQTSWMHTPAWIQDKAVLPLKPGYIPHSLDGSRFRWRMRSTTDIVFTPDGGQQETQNRTYLGEYAGTFRSTLYQKNESDRQDYLLKQYQNVVYELGEPSFSIEQLDEMAQELTISSEVQVAPFVTPGEPLSYFESDAWMKDELTALTLENERYAEQFPGLYVESEYNFDISGLWTLTDLPASMAFSHEFGYLTREVIRESPTRLKVRSKLRIPAQTVQLEDVKEFNRLLSTYASQSEIRFSGSPLTEN